MNEIRDIHNPFKAWLDQRGIPYHRNRPDKKTTAIKGDPDFLLTWCNYCVYIECKVSGGKLSKDQEKRIAYLRSAGNKVIVAYSLQDCMEAAQGILCHGGDKNALQPSVATQETATEPIIRSDDGLTSQLWLANIGNPTFVFSGDWRPGGLCKIVRTATPQDLATLPRK